ncbi:hypothetical protein ElyMa_001377700 [Elysia marginata]|uniref:Uncharacterized protein n=1 Tax=Elysia marginata TaxID=1093978 RepID=A0AAV4ITG6_9GAST|nr:hypothetical protein ElyMa_001377700 [Elysia marginata]
MTAPSLNWADQLPQSSQHARVQGGRTDFNISAPAGGTTGRAADKDTRPKSSEAFSTASETLSHPSKGRWSFPCKDSQVSPSTGGAVTSGTDSEVFVDTLTESSFDKTQSTSLSKERQTEVDHPQVTNELSYISSQPRSSELYVPPRSYISSSEPNTPEKDLVVYAEVHTNTSRNQKQVTSDKLSQSNSFEKDYTPETVSISDEVLVFGQSTSTSNLENFNSVLEEDTFSSISTIRTETKQGESSSGNQRPKVIESVVDFIYPSTGQKKTKVISKSAMPNGMVPSASCDEMRKDLCSSKDTERDKILTEAEYVTSLSQKSCAANSALGSSSSQSASVENDSTKPSNHKPGNEENFLNKDPKNHNPATHMQDEKDASSLTYIEDSQKNKFKVQGEGAELVAAAKKLVTDKSDAASEICHDVFSNDFTETKKSVEGVRSDSKENEDPHLSVNSSSGRDDSPKGSILDKTEPQDQNDADNIQGNINIHTKTDIGQGGGSQMEEFMTKGKGAIGLSSISSQIKESVTEGKEGIGLSSSSSQGSRSQSEEASVQQVLTHSKQEIDASLEVRLSGDESSALSSAEQHRHSMDSSTLSLAPGDLGPSKMRLTFEASESDNSDPGIMSPLSEGGLARGSCLSPVEELKTDSSSKKTLREEDDEDYAVRRLSSDFESRHVRGSSRSSQGEKSADSSNSPYWETMQGHAGEMGSMSAQTSVRSSPEETKCHKMTLYAQGHSDTLLLLLLSKNASCSKSYINSLWKTCLSHLAELDFEVKDAERHMKDDSENVGAAYQYMRYDSFSQSLKGSALLPVSGLANEMVDTCVKMHDTFDTMPDAQDITFRSHSACCFGHRAINTETYFQLGQPRNAAGICAQNDRTFSLDQLAGRILQNDIRISIL